MTVRRSEWDAQDVGAEPDWREDWCAWLTRYGIDPHDVCVPGWLEADDDARTIRYEVYARTDDGSDFVFDGSTLRRVVRVVQLEAPALPFPERHSGIYLVTDLADPAHPTARELAAGTRIGHITRPARPE